MRQLECNDAVEKEDLYEKRDCSVACGYGNCVVWL